MLPASVQHRLGGDASVVSVTTGEVIAEPGEQIVEATFPLDSVFSLDQIVSDDVENYAATPGVALVGNEGMIGIEAVFGANEWINRATVRIGGDMLRIKHAALLAEFSRAGVFQRLVLSSADSLIAQCCAIGACERVHSIRQRLIRWLLLFDDRIPNRDLGVTQAALSQLIGVRRASVSEAASGLQAQEFIAYQRGHIKIVDREGLEAGACRCYREIKRRSLSRQRGD